MEWHYKYTEIQELSPHDANLLFDVCAKTVIGPFFFENEDGQTETTIKLKPYLFSRQSVIQKSMKDY